MIFHQYKPSGSLTPANFLLVISFLFSVFSSESVQAEKKHLLTLSYGPAIYGEGGMLTTVERDIKLLENAVNFQILNAPEITPFIQQFGPIYRLPPFELRSDEVSIDYKQIQESGFQYGFAFRYITVLGKAEVPLAFLDLPRLGLFPVQTPFSRKSSSWFDLGSAFELQLQAGYHFDPDAKVDPYLVIAAGYGRGYLGEFSSGPYLEEYNITVGAGFRYRLNEDYYLSLEWAVVGHWVQTGTREIAIDFTEYIIVPRRGSLYLSRLRFGFGFEL